MLNTFQHASPSRISHFSAPSSSTIKTNIPTEELQKSDKDLCIYDLFAELLNRGFEIGHKLGVGAYSKVYYGRNDMGRPIACKVIDRRKTSEDFCSKFLPRELEILAEVNHENIVEVVNIFEMGPLICICLDYCPLGNLLDHIFRTGVPGLAVSKLYFRQVCSAVDYLHHNDISHRDIKCENILLYTSDVVKLSDFGFARKVASKEDLSQTYCGSSAYAAPELMLGVPYDPKSNDMWSLGCVLFFVIFGRLPFEDDNLGDAVKKQLNRCIVFPRYGQAVDILVEDLIRKLLNPDASRRLCINDVLHHNWITT